MTTRTRQPFGYRCDLCGASRELPDLPEATAAYDRHIRIQHPGEWRRRRETSGTRRGSRRLVGRTR